MLRRCTPVELTIAALTVGLLAWLLRPLLTEQGTALPGAVVAAAAETQQVLHEGDAADDPAIWVHPTDPLKTVVLGTDKKGGLGVYDLKGRELQYLEHGRINNVDLRSGIPFRGGRITVVAAGEKRHEQLLLYRLDPDSRLLERIPDSNFNLSVDPEGVCLYRSADDGALYAFISGEDLGIENSFFVEQWRIFERDAVPFGAERVRRLRIESQTEGLVADDELGHLYVGEENVGIWKYSAAPDAGSDRVLVDRTGERGHLTHDVEGLALYNGADATGYLIASSQGSDDFAVYRREGRNEYVGRFSVAESSTIDRVTHTDGIDANSASLGTLFPAGIFVAQDDKNDRGLQNFKIVSWQEIADKIEKRG
ncbi:MAG: phytase [Planctomycetota bacterium]